MPVTLPSVPIPEGWRLMLPNEVATSKDKCRPRHLTKWEEVVGYVGESPKDQLYWAFIRLDTKPKPDKEWLNPWD